MKKALLIQVQVKERKGLKIPRQQRERSEILVFLSFVLKPLTVI
jgi:hypothetical protein